MRALPLLDVHVQIRETDLYLSERRKTTNTGIFFELLCDMSKCLKIEPCAVST